MTTPPDFGGREIEEGLFEDLGGTREEYAQEHTQSHEDEAGSEVDDNEAHAPGMVCGLCRFGGTRSAAHSGRHLGGDAGRGSRRRG